MAYCTYTDVQNLVSQTIFSDTTRPTTTELSDWCDSISQEIDGVAKSADYGVPITATESVKILKRLCAHAVAAIAIRISDFASNPVDSGQADRYWSIYETGLDKIKTLPYYLHDAASEGTGGGATMRNYQDEAGDDAPDAEFEIDMDF